MPAYLRNIVGRRIVVAANSELNFSMLFIWLRGKINKGAISPKRQRIIVGYFDVIEYLRC
jgi:hypothetical protein